MKILSFNVEGLSAAKAKILSTICERENCRILCLQETHRGPTNNRPRIVGMRLAIERPHEKYGSAMFVKDTEVLKASIVNETNNIEVLKIEMKHLDIFGLYKPPNELFDFPKQHMLNPNKQHIVISDFNSHHTSWGYLNSNTNGERVQRWFESNGLHLVHDAKLLSSFRSGRWRRGFNLDIAFVSDRLTGTCKILSWIPSPTHNIDQLALN